MANNRIVFTVKLGELAEIPGTPFAYWAPASLRELFQKYPPLDRDVARRPDKPKIADVKVGLQTSDDLRFTRYWWEVPVEEIAASREETLQGKKWVPFTKGGQPFYHDIQLVVNWANEGEEIKNFREPGGRLRSRPQNESFYFRPGLAWALIAKSQEHGFDMFAKPAGTIHDVASHSIFVTDDETHWSFLAALNGGLLWRCFVLLEPTAHNRHIGYVAKLPIAPSVPHNSTLSRLAHEAYDLLREWDTGNETSTQFVAPWILQAWWQQKGRSDAELLPVTGHPLARDFAWSDWEGTKWARQVLQEVQGEGVLRPLAAACTRWEEALRRRLEEIQREIDEEVYRLYGINEEDRALIEAELGRPLEEEEETNEEEELEDEEEIAPEALVTPEEHIRRLVHYLAHEAIKEDPDGIVPLSDTYTTVGELERGLAYRVRAKLAELFGETAMPTVEQELREALGKTLDEWLTTDFFRHHTGLYRLRPIIWYIVSRPRGVPAFGCFIYWHKLDADTLWKVREVYLRPVLEGRQREANRLAAQYTEKRAAGITIRELRESERVWRQVEEQTRELRDLSERIQNLLQPHKLSPVSRSRWVVEKVNEIILYGYQPNRDYGVRVNIEPLKQAGVLPVDANRVKG